MQPTAQAATIPDPRGRNTGVRIRGGWHRYWYFNIQVSMEEAPWAVRSPEFPPTCYARFDPRGPGILLYLLFTISATVTLLVTAVLGIALADTIFGGAMAGHVWIGHAVTGVIILVGLVAMVAVYLLLARLHRAWRNLDRRGRVQRLKKIQAAAVAQCRLPHRQIEYLCRHKRKSIDQAAADVACAAGSVIILNDSRSRSRCSLVEEVHFEPIALASDSGALQELAALTCRVESRDASLRDALRTIVMSQRTPAASTARRGWLIFAMLVIVPFAILELTHGRYLHAASLVMMCIGALAGQNVSLRYDRAWLLPGLIAMQKSAILRRHERTLVAYPEVAILVLDDRHGHGCLTCAAFSGRGRMSLTFTFPPGTAAVVRAGWHSTVRRPTTSEITGVLEPAS